MPGLAQVLPLGQYLSVSVLCLLLSHSLSLAHSFCHCLTQQSYQRLPVVVALQRAVPCEALVTLLLPLSLTSGALLPTDALVDVKAGTTLLHSAVQRGMPSVATALLEAGADPNPKVRK